MKKSKLGGLLALTLLLCAGCADTTVPETSSERDEPVSSQVSESSEPVVESPDVSTTESESSESEPVERHTVSFYDENGNLIESKDVEEGKVPSCDYEPTDTEQYDYTLEGWSLSEGGEKVDLAPVTGDVSYYAIVSSVIQKYTLTLKSGNATLSSTEYDYGTVLEEDDLAEPETDETHYFVAWCLDSGLSTPVEFPYTVTSDAVFHASFNEKIDISGFLKTLVDALSTNPTSYIPSTLLPEGCVDKKDEADLAYDFTSFVRVGSIDYGGYGEQWNMVVTNLAQTERFFYALGAVESTVAASVAVFNNYIDENPADFAQHSFGSAEYSAFVSYADGILAYSLSLKSGISIPLLGEVTPQIDMVYDIENNVRAVRVNLTEDIALRYAVEPDSYSFGIKYGAAGVHRTAYFQISEEESGLVHGHIYEYVGTSESDLIKSCADFYIDGEYLSVVGNKASGMVAYDGYINELYLVEDGKLLGYEVRETKTIAGFESTYHTLWFNLRDIDGITSVKVTEKAEAEIGPAVNPHDVYVNGSSTVFEPTYNSQLFVKTSRKYDIEMRSRYFVTLNESGDEEVVEVELPMMFIQADHDGYTNFTDFPGDILETSGINASVALYDEYLEKIQADYATLIDVFIENKDKVNSETIRTFIGNPVTIA